MQEEEPYKEYDVLYPNVITFQEFCTIKQYGNLTKGFDKFQADEIDNIAVFYDEDMVFLDYLERREVEELHPSFVLLPRFFWEQHIDTIPTDFIPSLQIEGRIKELKEYANGYWHNLSSRMLTNIRPVNCDAEPREEQKPVMDFFVQTMNTQHKLRGVLQAAPGVGKTFMSIKMTSAFRARSLIIVPNEVLQDQWKDAILQFTDTTEDRIGIIQGSDLSKVEKEIDFETKDIMIVKIQSLYSQIKRNKLHEIQGMYKHIDMVFYDECHNSGAATSYAKTSSLFFTPNIVGLSATPYRIGLNDYLLKTSIGETIYKVEHNNLTPDVEIHNVYVPFTEEDTKRVMQVKGDYNMQLGVFGSRLKTKDTYFQYLSDVVAFNRSQGHDIVVLFPTIALMEKLMGNLELRHPKVFEESLLLKGKTKQDAMEMVKEERKVLMQEYKEFKEFQDTRVKSKEIKRKEYTIIVKAQRAQIDSKLEYLKVHALDLYKENVNNSKIIVSNYNLLSAGFDKSSLSNIIFGGAPRIGKIAVIQSIGRITRVHAGKLTPLAQYFIPSPFFDINSSTGIILNRNIKVQYEDAKFNYQGFK